MGEHGPPRPMPTVKSRLPKGSTGTGENGGWPLVCELEGVRARWFYVRNAANAYAAREAVARAVKAEQEQRGECPSLAGLHPRDPATVECPTPYEWLVVVEYRPEEHKGHDYG